VESASVCPKCGYARKRGDTAPEWQCPSCGIAIEKYRAQQEAGRLRLQSSVDAAHASNAAMAAAAANPVTAALVREAHWIELPPRLRFERRLGMALLDLLMAAVFLWCWLNPGAWRPTLAQELGLIMLMEFFVIHSSVFLAAGSGEGASGAKATLGFIVMLFYLPVAGAFAWWHGGGWWPILAFAWLLSSRVAAMLAGHGSDAFESKRARYYWATGGGLYVMCGFAAIFLPIPQLGFHRHGQFVWEGFWTIPPQDVMAWGFLYFGLQALLKLLEKPEWIVAEPE
jgi:hypothetical protein